MLLKYHLITLLILLFSLSASAQFRQNVYYLKNDETQVSTKDSADFTRIITAQDSVQKIFEIKEYYKNGNVKLLGQTSYINYKSLTGLCRLFYPSGKKQRVATYKDGYYMVGEAYDFYPDGSLYTLKRYSAIKEFALDGEQINYIVVAFQDSAGKALVTDSSGHFIDYNPTFSRIRAEGEIIKGKKTGEWKGIADVKDSIKNFTEIYKDGVLIKGTSAGLNGKIYNYTKREILPEFVGGDKGFNRYLSTSLIYPELAKQNFIQGRVFISFFIEKDGSLSNFNILRDPGSGLGQEALRVLSTSPKWVAGVRFGKPAIVKYTVPVNFALVE